MMLKAYVMHAGEQQEAGCLVFAESFRKAKALAFNGSVVCEGGDYIDVRGQLIKHDQWLKANAAHKDRLKAGIPHVIDTPPCCESCELWGDELFDGYCESCADEREEVDAEGGGS